MILNVQNVSKSFGENEVLSDVFFSVSSGSISTLLGINGSGKTTLFNLISGFLKLDSGKILINDIDIIGIDPYLLNRQGIVRTFQDLRLIEDLTVKENVLLAFKNQKGEKWWRALFPKWIYMAQVLKVEKKAIEILENTFILDIANSKAGEISYGQQKLLTIACCIANDGNIILLDEPVAGINPVIREKMIGLLQSLKKQGKAILIIEHDTEFVEQVSDNIFFLNEGYVTSFSDFDKFRNNSIVKEAYI